MKIRLFFNKLSLKPSSFLISVPKEDLSKHITNYFLGLNLETLMFDKKWGKIIGYEY